MRVKAGIMQKDKNESINIVVRKMAENDIDKVASIEQECFSMPWSNQAFHDEFENEDALTFVAFCNSDIAGFINGRLVLDEMYINNVAVTLKMRKHGIAKALLNFLENSVKDKVRFITLEVRQSNIAARTLYQKNGYESVGTRRNFYQEPIEDAILMTKTFHNVIFR